MALILSEEQKLLKDSATEFLAMNAPVEQFRDLRDNNYKAFDESLWSKIVEMGWTALTIPEEPANRGPTFFVRTRRFSYAFECNRISSASFLINKESTD